MKSALLVLGCCSMLFLFNACEKQQETSSQSSSTGSRADSMKAAITATFEGLRTGNLDVLDKYFANDLIEHTSAVFRDGKIDTNWIPGLKEFITGQRAKYTNAKLEVEAICIDGDICAVRTRSIDDVKSDSVGSKTVKQKHTISTAWLRWQDGKFVESWDAKDEEYSSK